MNLHLCICICYNVFRCCGVKDPSWAEIRHFVKFLDLQLLSCEKSYFTNEDFVGDVLTGFKSFVVKFMIRMSRVGLCLIYHYLSCNIFS